MQLSRPFIVSLCASVPRLPSINSTPSVVGLHSRVAGVPEWVGVSPDEAVMAQPGKIIPE